MKIKFCGAAGTVTGSTHLLTLDNGFNILLDCGLFQGGDEAVDDWNRRWGFDPSEIDVLLLSHAHIDHCGRIPRLIKDGFKGKIYCTAATKDLAGIMLMDSANIQEQDAEYLSEKQNTSVHPLYTIEDTIYCLSAFRGKNYHEWFSIHPDVEVLFKDAGHILGSASITLKIKENGKETKVGFSGDIGRPDRPILKDPDPIENVDFLICESTYGGEYHEDKPTEEHHLLQIIFDTCVAKEGKLIIPAFSVGRTQELVYKLNKLSENGQLPPIPVFIDSPLAVNATDIFRKHPECFDEETNRHLQEDDDVFGFQHLRYVRTVTESKALNKIEGPCIIISSSGMAQAGRIKHHIANNIEKMDNTILMVGYCSPGTLGGILLTQPETVKIYGKELRVRADIESLGSMSAHGDQGELTDFLRHQSPEHTKVFLVHGEDNRRQKFKEHLENIGFQHIYIPEFKETIILE